MSNNRNLPCWCGSGKKYKKCHLHREEQKKVDTWDMVGKFKREFNKKYCLCPKSHKTSCQGKIINAHTVSKSGSLKQISRNGHIYTFLPTLEKFIQTKDKAKILPELTGINKASTFTGFCKTHDRILFSPIENDDFIATKEQIFLLSYRALSREVFAKAAFLNIEEPLREADKGRSILEQKYHQNKIDNFSFGAELAGKDLKYQKEKFDEMLTTQDFKEIRGFVIETNKIPSLMCCGGHLPYFDFNGEMPQNIYNFSERLKVIYLNIFSSNNTGYVVFSWLKSDSTMAEKFINSFEKIEDSRKTDAIIRFAFSCFENKFSSPDWWESLSASKQKLLSNKFLDAVSPNTDVNPNLLVEDNVKYDNWEIKHMKYM